MKPEHISDAMDRLDSDLVERADRARQRRRGKPFWIAAVAAVLVLCVGAAAFFPLLHPATVSAEGVIAEAEYPQMAQYPRYEDYEDDWDAYDEAYRLWWESQQAQYDQQAGYADGLEAFYLKTAREFLSDAEGKNLVYSPLNVYMALAMLAEVTGGESRAQILDLLGADSIERLRDQAGDVWNAAYCVDGLNTTVLANSVWLDEDITFRQETMDRLAQIYYADAYRGAAGSEALNQTLRDWLNERTGGLLADQIEGVEMEPRTVMALASTVYFKAPWSAEFWEEETAPEVFHSPTGDVTVDFMRQSDGGTLYLGKQYSAVKKCMEGSCAMWLILPDEGVSPEELLLDGEALEMTTAADDWGNTRFGRIQLSMPKFDVYSNFDLSAGLQNLGVTDVFDKTRSDFSPMTDMLDALYVSKAEHAARVTVDEKGCTAAAYTVIAAEGAAELPDDAVDFTLDRPFLFVITDRNDQPLFIGVVNQP